MNHPAADSPPVSVPAAYARALERRGLRSDDAQKAIVDELEQLRRALEAAGPVRRGPRRWLGRRRAPDGLYLRGRVGRGKTFLMDLFFDCLAFEDKQRVHFHRFMQRVHRHLSNFDGADPLPALARRLARRARVLCFDEFFVSDIGDAMILGTTLQALFDEGVTVVATSNVAPDNLYRGGLQRRRFLPAIEAIKAHMAVACLDGGVDYRLRALEGAQTYHAPLDAAARPALERAFERLGTGGAPVTDPVRVNGRALPVVRRSDGVIWFDFETLCNGPRAASDYVELAREYHSILLASVPRMDDTTNNAARRFIALVDECYDRGVKLILTAAAPLDSLYTGERLAFAFRRTASRLVEMQSKQYLARGHRAD